MLYMSSFAETVRLVSMSLKEKVKGLPYPVTNSICVVEFERKGEKLGGDDSPAGLKRKEVSHC